MLLTASSRQSDYYAPIWSWVSITGPVMYDHEMKEGCFEMKESNFRILEIAASLGTRNP